MPKRNSNFSYWGSISVDHFPTRLVSKISFSAIRNFNLTSTWKQNHEKAISNRRLIPANLRLTLSFDSGKKVSEFFRAGRTASPSIHIKFWHLDIVLVYSTILKDNTRSSTWWDRRCFHVHLRTALAFKQTQLQLHPHPHSLLHAFICKQVCYEKYISIKKEKRRNSPHSPERSTLFVEHQ